MRTLEAQLDIAFEHRQGLSCRKIARKLGCNPRTVKKYIEHPELVGKPRKASAPRPSKLDRYREHIAAYLDDDADLRATLIYERLCRQGYTGGYAMVQRAVRPLRAQKQARAYLRFETEPGAQAQVDFGEFVVELADGSVRRYYLFALILGYSRMLYAELLERCDMCSFLGAHIRALEALGGVPSEVLYDRMRNVFLGRLAGKGQAQFTQSLVELATHYGFTPRVAPAYAPWVKGKVERPMDFIREGFWRGYSFVELSIANRDLARWLSEKSQRVHGTTHERVDERFAREKLSLGALPAHACDVSERLYREVRKDCTIAVLGNRYVLEHTLVGRQVVARVSRETSHQGPQLRVFDGERLVVSYAIPEGKGHLVQDPRFYAALRADREQAERKFGRSPQRSFARRKGRATLSPSAPAHPLDVRPLVAPLGQTPAVDVQPVAGQLERVGVEVQHRPLSDYAWLGGEVGHA